MWETYATNTEDSESVCDHGSVANHYERLYLPLNGLDDAFDCRFGLHWRQDVICGLECDGHGFQAVIALSSTLLPHEWKRKFCQFDCSLLLVELCKPCHSLRGGRKSESEMQTGCHTLIWPPPSRSQVSSSVWFPPSCHGIYKIGESVFQNQLSSSYYRKSECWEDIHFTASMRHNGKPNHLQVSKRSS